jgi:hypothetical protein
MSVISNVSLCMILCWALDQGVVASRVICESLVISKDCVEVSWERKFGR